MFVGFFFAAWFRVVIFFLANVLSFMCLCGLHACVCECVFVGVCVSMCVGTGLQVWDNMLP